jgi:hypothetical protein
VRAARGLVLALLFAAATSGCVQSFDSTTLGVPVTMAAAPGDAASGTAFKTSSHSVYGLWGLITISQANLQKELARQLVGGQQITQLKIKTKSRWSDLLFTVLTVGLIVPRTVRFEGVIIGR